MLQSFAIEMSKPMQENFQENPYKVIDKKGVLMIGDCPTSLKATTFQYILQQNRKQLANPD